MGKRLFNRTLEPWIVYVEMRRVRAEQLRSALSKLTNRALRRALLAWAQLIVDEVEERHVAETDARRCCPLESRPKTRTLSGVCSVSDV